MGPRRRKLWNRSGGMTDLPHRPTLFIDRNSGGRIFRELIEKEGIRVVLHDDCFKQDTGDEVWLREISKRGWIMITCDADTLKSPLFLRNLKLSNGRVFLLNGLDGGTRQEKAKCVVDSYDTIIEVCRKREPPLFWRINREGKATVIDFKHKLGLLRRAGKAST
jgi:PIN like domain